MPRRKVAEKLPPAPAGSPWRVYKLRLPTDVADRIEQKAETKKLPVNRIIIDELSSVPYLESEAKLPDSLRQLDVILGRMGARITWHDLQDELLNAVDAVLGAPANAAALDKLRAVRTGMLIHKRAMKKRGEP
jgi:hypothetical protein